MIVLPVNGAGETGQLHAKERNLNTSTFSDKEAKMYNG